MARRRVKRHTATSWGRKKVHKKSTAHKRKTHKRKSHKSSAKSELHVTIHHKCR